MIIDFHTHILPPGLADKRRHFAGLDAAFAAIYTDEKAPMATAEDLIASMDEGGVAVSVVANYGWVSDELCRETNDYILEAVAKYPSRLVGFTSVTLSDAKSSVSEIERCARGGARGIGELRPDIQLEAFPDIGLIAELDDTLKAHNLMLMTHVSEPVGHEYPGKGRMTPDVFSKMLGALPGVTVIGAHWGGGLPFYALMPEVKESFENAYVDSAASPFLYRAGVFKEVCRVLGPEHILFGTDYPLLSPARLLGDVENAGLTDAEKTLILSGNAKRLLGI